MFPLTIIVRNSPDEDTSRWSKILEYSLQGVVQVASYRVVTATSSSVKEEVSPELYHYANSTGRDYHSCLAEIAHLRAHLDALRLFVNEEEEEALILDNFLHPIRNFSVVWRQLRLKLPAMYDVIDIGAGGGYLIRRQCAKAILERLVGVDTNQMIAATRIAAGAPCLPSPEILMTGMSTVVTPPLLVLDRHSLSLGCGSARLRKLVEEQSQYASHYLLSHDHVDLTPWGEREGKKVSKYVYSLM
jgi:hypothetical protein